MKKADAGDVFPLLSLFKSSSTLEIVFDVFSYPLTLLTDWLKATKAEQRTKNGNADWGPQNKHASAWGKEVPQL